MPDMSARQLMKEYSGRKGVWVIHRADVTIGVPIQVVDVKVTYGQIRLLCEVAGTTQTLWLGTSSVKLDQEEN